MSWLKHVIIDLLATLVILIVVFHETTLLEYVLYIYTGLMVLARSSSFFRIDMRAITKEKHNVAPLWIYHLLYFLNVSILLFGQFYITSLFWLFIWVAAAIVYYKDNKIP